MKWLEFCNFGTTELFVSSFLLQPGGFCLNMVIENWCSIYEVLFNMYVLYQWVQKTCLAGSYCCNLKAYREERNAVFMYLLGPYVLGYLLSLYIYKNVILKNTWYLSRGKMLPWYNNFSSYWKSSLTDFRLAF